MATLQRTLVSGSIWIGTSSSVQDLGNYQDSHHLPLAIYKNSDAVFNFNTQGTTNVLYLNTSSIRSANYQSGFDPTNQGNRGFAIDLIDNRYVAQFDDLWVRGTMNVHQFVINQIRATNGSLWVSDAAKATSASSTSLGLVLQFESGSALPFVQGDIIRSKRWVVTQTQVQNWDIITVVNSINYTDCYLTGSLVGTTYWTASPQSLGNLTQSAGSDWVRIGHTSSTTGRQGGIYLTAGDKNSPYIDIYDSVSNVAGGHYNDSGSVDYTVNNVLKARLGKLTGISDVAFGGSLQGYGLYADNAYLRGWIVANQGGNIAGWTINPGTLSNKDMRLVASNYESYLAVKTQIYAGEGIWIGTSSAGARLSIGGANDNFLRWTGTQLQIKTANFSMSNGNVSMSGTVSATTGKIGGWNIANDKLYNGNVSMSATSGDSYLGFNTATWLGNNSIYIGSGSQGPRFGVSGSNGYFWFSNSSIAFSTSNFSAADGNVTLSGKITAGTGNIGGWTIAPNRLYSSNVSLNTGNNSQSINIGASAYSTSGIYLGSSSTSGNQFSITNLANGLFWDGNNLGVTTSNFTLSQGNIIAKGGTVGGWNINNLQISKSTNDYGLTMRSQPSLIWGYVTNSGYVFNPDNPTLASVLRQYYSASAETYQPWNPINQTSSVGNEGKRVIVKYTSSMANAYKNIVAWKAGTQYQIQVEAGQTIFIGVDQIQFDGPMFTKWNGSPYSDTLTLFAYTESNPNVLLSQILVMRAGLYTSASVLKRTNLFSSYTNKTNLGQTLSLGLFAKTVGRPSLGVQGTVWDLLGFTLSGITVFKSKGYTQLNPQGLLIYAGPTNYIKITTHPTGSGYQNYGIIAVDQLYVKGQPVIGGTSGGGGAGGLSGGGTAGTLPVWIDVDSLDDSIISQNNNTVSIAGQLNLSNAFTASQGIQTTTISGSGLATFGNITTSGYIRVAGAITSSTGFSGSGANLTNLTWGNVVGFPAYNGAVLSGASVISDINITTGGVITTASRTLTPADIGAVPTSRTLQIQGTTNQITVNNTAAYDLSTDRSWIISLPAIVSSSVFSGSTFTSSDNINAAGAISSSTGFWANGTSNFVAVNATNISGSGTLQIGGNSTFAKPITVSQITGQSPFSISSTTLVTNLNADTVDGKHINTLASGGILYASNADTISSSVLTGVLKGNGSGVPTAMTGTANRVTRWSDANTIEASTNLLDDGTQVTTSVKFTASNGIEITNGYLYAKGTGISGSGTLQIGGNSTLGNTVSNNTSIYGTLYVKNTDAIEGTILCDNDGYLILNGSSVQKGVQISDGILWLGYSGSNGIKISSGSYGGTSYTGGMISSSMKIVALHGFANRTNDGDASFEVDINGNLQCASLKETSLRAYKHEIQYITESQLLNISKLKPITFLYNQDVPQDVNDKRLRQAGFIAEQVQQIYPEVAWYKDGKLAGLQYQRLTAYLTRGIQELAEQNKLLKSRVQSLEQLVNGILQGAK